MTLLLTLVGTYIGYRAHRYEETSEERTEERLAKYRHVPKLWVSKTRLDDVEEEDGINGTLCKFALITAHFMLCFYLRLTLPTVCLVHQMTTSM